MKRNKIIKAIAIAMALVSAFAVGVGAADSVREVTAYVNYAMTMKVDNTEWNPTEDDGSAVRPIIYNNRTYLPLRALCDKLGVAVDYDGNTQTVYVGEKEWTPLVAEMSKSHGASKQASFTIDPDALYNGHGVYKWGITVNPDWIDNMYADHIIEVGKSFAKIKGSVYVSGGAAKLVIKDKETDQMYKTLQVDKDTSVEFEADISGADKLVLKWYPEKDKTVKTITFGDIQFK